MSIRGLLTLATCVLVFSAGCTHDRPLRLDLNESVSIPDRPAILFFVDGLQHELFEKSLANGGLPNIKKYLVDRGTSVRQAVASIPSLTYPNTVSFVTGLWPGHHHILGNKWFDRATCTYRDYPTTKTYRMVDDDFAAPTIFELLGPNGYSISIQTPCRRGVTRKIDNWATSGINWFFGGYKEVDKLVAMRLELIAEDARARNRWPNLIFAYFPGCDEVAHRWGPDSPEYRAAVTNVDAQIGRICQALERAGLLDQSYLALVSDHGMVPTRQHEMIEEILRRTCEFLVPHMIDRPPRPELSPAARKAYFARADLVTVNGGYRRLVIHVRCADEPWETGGFRPARVALAKKIFHRAGLSKLRSVALTAFRAGPDRVLMENRAGCAEILRDRQAKPPRYAYRLLSGDPLRYQDSPRAAGLVGGWHTDEQWLAATLDTEFPDLVPQVVAMFDSDRAGDLVLFAAPGWDFSGGSRGGHGSALAADMIVPMVFAGPAIAKGRQIRYARNVDVMPTILDLMGLAKRLQECGRLDGKSRKRQLMAENSGS